MRYWWVNQNQTYNAEFTGGYIWSPKRNKNGARKQFYENMRIVGPGDVIFSFWDTMIVAVGRSVSYCYDAQKPEEFGARGVNWETQPGWCCSSSPTCELPRGQLDKQAATKSKG
jgi:hypothetical protein